MPNSRASSKRTDGVCSDNDCRTLSIFLLPLLSLPSPRKGSALSPFMRSGHTLFAMAESSFLAHTYEMDGSFERFLSGVDGR